MSLNLPHGGKEATHDADDNRPLVRRLVDGPINHGRRQPRGEHGQESLDRVHDVILGHPMALRQIRHSVSTPSSTSRMTTPRPPSTRARAARIIGRAIRTRNIPTDGAPDYT